LYEERLRKESELESMEADAALAKSIQDAENVKLSDHINAKEVHESIQHPHPEENEVRAPMRTGYTERLISGGSTPEATSLGGFWNSLFNPSSIGNSERLLPVSNQNNHSSSLSRWMYSIRKNIRSIIIILTVMILMLYVMIVASK